MADIFLDVEGLTRQMKKMVSEAQNMPNPTEVGVSEGGTSEITKQFRDEVTRSAQILEQLTRNIIDTLNAKHQTITDVVKQLAENDASLADDAKKMLALLDSAEKAPAAPPTSEKKSNY